MAILNNLINSIRMKIVKTQSLIIDWSLYDKSIFILYLGVLQSLGTLNWYFTSFHLPDTRQWLNEQFFFFRSVICLVTLAVYVMTILLAHHYKNNLYFQKIMPYFSPMLFGGIMIYSGYTIGIYNPVTLAGYVSIFLVGLVLYDRKIIYFVIIPVTIYILVMCYYTTVHHLPYAPVFSEKLNHSLFYKNQFWVTSMVFLYLPIFVVCILLFELLLWQWRSRENQYELFSKIDFLTGVYNRRYIDVVIQNLIKKQRPYSLILLDLDFFKNVNDVHGHATGDRVLKRIAEVLVLNMREDDIVGRFGGEEFILLLPNQTLQQAIDIAECCRSQIEKENIAISPTKQLKISASFGVATSQADTREDIVSYADEALYRAKALGRNQVQFKQKHTFDEQ
ncbi:GGDEF domain-containing protein [Acinetobacter shaoyimingii]|uniref:diguanylate cyclase n=1 Tax=Acinetobacter shaoyimingii TaxID=2715164 RepID=A0A6G8RU62_9GAMM|nr:GGDEF domain-containing protein [Acinetobacter shaoyimingii]QIO05253.1 GGDEF domain-containing protein [Acinetobacter shaoyimingii]